MGHPFLSYSVDLRQRDADGLVCFCAGFSLGFCLSLGFGLCLHGFGFAEEDFAEAGWASLFFDLFRVGALLGRADEGAIFVFVDFTDRLRGYFFFGGLRDAVAVVLRGYLQAVDEDAGAAGIDPVGGQGEDYVGDGELDGVGVFERGEVVGGVLWRDVGFVGVICRGGLFAGVGVEVAEVLVCQCG